jgi:FtsP/CotA-like multicopper oxidase with cupredoxin domain
VIENPCELTWNNHGSHFDAELDVDYANIELDVGTLRTRAYRDPNNGCGYTVPGPTMKLVPGQEYVIRFRNYMPFSPPSSDVNSLKDPDITNLHTHGLHIKPSQAPMVTGGALGDHVMVSFEGGTGGDYCYEIPPDHMGGQYGPTPILLT